MFIALRDTFFVFYYFYLHIFIPSLLENQLEMQQNCQAQSLEINKQK